MLVSVGILFYYHLLFMTETKILMAKVRLTPNTASQLVISRNHGQTELGLLLDDETPRYHYGIMQQTALCESDVEPPGASR